MRYEYDDDFPIVTIREILMRRLRRLLDKLFPGRVMRRDIKTLMEHYESLSEKVFKIEITLWPHSFVYTEMMIGKADPDFDIKHIDINEIKRAVLPEIKAQRK